MDYEPFDIFESYQNLDLTCKETSLPDAKPTMLRDNFTQDTPEKIITE